MEGRFSSITEIQVQVAPFFTPVCCEPFSFNILCQFTSLLIHVHLVFGVLPFGWLRARTLPILCETDGIEQNREDERSHDQGEALRERAVVM